MPSTLPGLGPGPTETARAASRVIVGGVVAHNDERHIEASLRSLLTQELPPGVRWGRVWVVASGCTDRTEEIARAVAEEDPRVSVVVEAERRGKAAAIRQVLSRAEGDLLVLLNSDAVAAPGAVGSLLTKATSQIHPFAVMARPVTSTMPYDDWGSTMRWMWELHHELHLEMLKDGSGSHLSDELLLVSLPPFPWIEDGIINDGSYCAVWLRDHAGSCWYAPDARVFIDVPSTRQDHLLQRRRIHVGNAQVAERLGRHPTTALRFLLNHPGRAFRALRRAAAQDHAARHLVRIAAWELAARALAAWDRLPPRRDHVRWVRIATPTAAPRALGKDPISPARIDDVIGSRLQVLLRVAREFDTGVSLERLAELLPGHEPWTEERLRGFLATRPEIARIKDGRAYSASFGSAIDPERADRGEQYLRAAQSLTSGPLAWLHRWVRCLGVTGSTAYGEPRPGDDLDFYVVTRGGAVPWFLFATYLTLRFRRPMSGSFPAPTPCFNYVVDDRRAPDDFGRARGLLFSREALSARMLVGDEYYRGLLSAAPWMGADFPHLYSTRAARGADTAPRPAPPLVRLLSGVVYLPLAAYLQLTGLLRNSRSRKRGQESETFRTVTAPDRFAFESQRFEQLRVRYERPPEPSPSFTATGGPSRITTLR